MTDLEKQIYRYKRKNKYSVLAIIGLCLYPIIAYSYITVNYLNLDVDFLVFLFTTGYIALIYLFHQNADLKIQDFVKLTDNQIWYYNWMDYLDKRKVVTNIEEFEKWMSGFEDRYSEDQMFAMKLFFKVKGV